MDKETYSFIREKLMQHTTNINFRVIKQQNDITLIIVPLTRFDSETLLELINISNEFNLTFFVKQNDVLDEDFPVIGIMR